MARKPRELRPECCYPDHRRVVLFALARAQGKFGYLEALGPGLKDIVGPTLTALYFLVLTLGIGLANPQGLTLLLTLVLSLEAGGLALGPPESCSHKLALALGVPTTSMILGVVIAGVRAKTWGSFTNPGLRP